MEKPSSGGVESARLAAALVWNAVASFPSVQGATMAVARRESLHRAGRAYQRSERGRRLHARRRTNPTDRAKGGSKQSLLTEAAGIPVGLAVDGANRVDFNLARETLESIPLRRPRPTKERPQGLCLDKGNDYPEIDKSSASPVRSPAGVGRNARSSAPRAQGAPLGSRANAQMDESLSANPRSMGEARRDQRGVTLYPVLSHRSRSSRLAQRG
jgi:hypothetical protein